MATFQPWPSAPRRLDSCTRQPSKNSSANAGSPSRRPTGLRSRPSESAGTSRYERPLWRCEVGSVRTMQNSQSAHAPREHQVFWPSRTNHSPSLTPRVVMEARSLPAFGSDQPWDQRSSPDAIRGRKRSFCSSVP